MKRTLLFLALCATLPQAWAIGHLANVEVIDRMENRSLPVYWHQGRAWVVGAPGHEYRLALRNSAPDDVLAVVSVDGVNVVSGETASPAQSGYVIDAGTQLDVSGWRKSLSQTAAFYFTSLGDSYAARTDRPGNVGVIGVALYRRKSAPALSWLDSPRSKSMAAPAAPAEPMASGDRAQAAPAPRYQERREDAAGSRQAPLGTGHGRRENSDAAYTSFERATRYPAEQVAIYYDSYANLVARGVIAESTWRDPQPFPGSFVADPPR